MVPPPPPRRRKKPGTYHHGNLREALLSAALELVAEVGPRAFTLRETARRAGVSHAAPYRHFADKEALLAAVAEEGFHAFAAALRAAMDVSEAERPGDVAARLRAQGIAYVRFAVEHPSRFRIMFGSDVGDRAKVPSLQAAGAEAFRLLVDGIAACQRAGHVRAGDPAELAVMPWSLAHGLALLIIDGPIAVRDGAALEALAGRVLGDIFVGLAAR